MNIEIMSHGELFTELKTSPGKYSVIFIANHGDCDYYRTTKSSVLAMAKDLLMMEFMDIELGSYDADHPENWLGATPKHIEEILKFAEGKEDIICCCHAGVSRSSAVAYTIKCTKENPKEALSLLSVRRHQPNLIIVEYGAKLLNKPEMTSLVREWIEKVWSIKH